MCDALISFPKKMSITVSIIVLLANLVIFARFYWFSLSPSLLLVITIVEILVIVINFVYLARKYKIKL